MSKKLAVGYLVISILILSLLDLVFNLNGFKKNLLFETIWLILLAIFILSSYKLLGDFKFENKYFQVIFYTFLFYGFITVIRGWSFENKNLTTFLRVPYIFWPFFIPFFVFFDKRLEVIGFLLKCFYNLGVIFLFLAICFPSLLLNRQSAEIIIFTMVIGSGFLLLNVNYLPNGKINVLLLIISLSILSLIYLARRSGLSLLVGFLFFSFLLNFFNKSVSLLFKSFPFLLIFIFIIFLNVSNFSLLLTKNLNQRIFQDTRSTVIEMFFADMKNDFLFGKGMNGTYFCPIGSGLLQDDGMTYTQVDYREVIENGYLQLMLSGGIIHIVLFLLIVLPAAFYGIFQSSNQFTKTCGIMIILWLVYMFGFGQPGLNFGYILVWICVGICYKKSIRSKNDAEVSEEFELV